LGKATFLIMALEVTILQEVAWSELVICKMLCIALHIIMMNSLVFTPNAVGSPEGKLWKDILASRYPFSVKCMWQLYICRMPHRFLPVSDVWPSYGLMLDDGACLISKHGKVKLITLCAGCEGL